MKRYFVKKQQNEISPEEILVDTYAEDQKILPKIEFPVSRSLTLGIFILTLLFLTGTLITAGYYQIFRHQYFLAWAEENKLKQVLLEAPRGIIIDRYGKIIAENKIFYEVILIPEELPQDSFSYFQQIKLLAKTLNKDPKEIQQLIEEKKRMPNSTVFSNLTIEQAIQFQARATDLKGFYLVGRFVRFYPYGEATSHLVGYTGYASQQDLINMPGIMLGEIIGKTGIEHQYNAFLKGEKGKFSYGVNARQEIIEDKEVSYYKTGKTLILTIDAELQEKIYSTLKNFIGTKYGGGAGIALNPKTGELLALVSYPGIDTNKLVAGISSEILKRLFQSPQKPFFNRAISGEYSPGSTIKPFIALAALEEQIIDPETKINDFEGKIIVPNPYFPDKPYIFRDWKAHGSVNMKEAIGDSCNVYFYTIGGGYGNIKGLGAGRIKKYLQEFGWGEPTGVDLAGEKSGFIPDPEWKEKNEKEIWRIGDTYNLSIGQGYIKTTPLQLAVNAAALINNGNLWKPYVVLEIREPETNTTIIQTTPFLRENIPAKPENLEIIKQGMRYTVIGGSAQRLQDLPFSTAGKTGSVQISSDLTKTNALFFSFMPAEDPQFLLFILVEGGGQGGATAVSLSKEILYWYWENRILSNSADKMQTKN